MVTRAQQRTLDYIRRHCLQYGHAPSLAEIALGIGIRSRGVIHRNVQALADAGAITLQPGRKRGIRLAEDVVISAYTLPMLGRIAAGKPIEAVPGQDTLDLAVFLLGPDRFALQVRGDSMIEAGILDGDTVIVRQGSEARDDDIVIALIDSQEATLKRIKRRADGNVMLIAANKAIPPLIYSAERVTIQGVVVGQMRSY